MELACRPLAMKGTNRPIIIFVTSVLAVSTIFCLLLSSSSIAYVYSPDNWPMFHHDIGHTGYSPSSRTPIQDTLLWNYTTNSVVGASPAIVDGHLFIGSDAGVAYCINALDGSEVWNFTVPINSQIVHGVESIAISSSMAVANGKVYFGCYDRNIYCLNAATGAELWNFTTGNTVESCPSIVNGYLYVGSWDGNVYCINAADGTKIWSFKTGGLVESSPAIANGYVFAGSADGKVYCFDAASGAEIWNYTTGNIVESSPTVIDNRLYVGSDGNNVYCLNATNGNKIWNYPTQSWVTSTPAVANGYVYVGTGESGSANPDKNVYCLNAADRSENLEFCHK